MSFFMVLPFRPGGRRCRRSLSASVSPPYEHGDARHCGDARRQELWARPAGVGGRRVEHFGRPRPGLSLEVELGGEGVDRAGQLLALPPDVGLDRGRVVPEVRGTGVVAHEWARFTVSMSW